MATETQHVSLRFATNGVGALEWRVDTGAPVSTEIFRRGTQAWATNGVRLTGSTETTDSRAARTNETRLGLAATEKEVWIESASNPGWLAVVPANSQIYLNVNAALGSIEVSAAATNPAPIALSLPDGGSAAINSGSSARLDEFPAHTYTLSAAGTVAALTADGQSFWLSANSPPLVGGPLRQVTDLKGVPHWERTSPTVLVQIAGSLDGDISARFGASSVRLTGANHQKTVLSNGGVIEWNQNLGARSLEFRIVKGDFRVTLEGIDGWRLIGLTGQAGALTWERASHAVDLQNQGAIPCLVALAGRSYARVDPQATFQYSQVSPLSFATAAHGGKVIFTNPSLKLQSNLEGENRVFALHRGASPRASLTKPRHAAAEFATAATSPANPDADPLAPNPSFSDSPPDTRSTVNLEEPFESLEPPRRDAAFAMAPANLLAEDAGPDANAPLEPDKRRSPPSSAPPADAAEPQKLSVSPVAAASVQVDSDAVTDLTIVEGSVWLDVEKDATLASTMSDAPWTVAPASLNPAALQSLGAALSGAAVSARFATPPFTSGPSTTAIAGDSGLNHSSPGSGTLAAATPGTPATDPSSTVSDARPADSGTPATGANSGAKRSTGSSPSSAGQSSSATAAANSTGLGATALETASGSTLATPNSPVVNLPGGSTPSASTVGGAPTADVASAGMIPVTTLPPAAPGSTATGFSATPDSLSQPAAAAPSLTGAASAASFASSVATPTANPASPTTPGTSASFAPGSLALGGQTASLPGAQLDVSRIAQPPVTGFR